MLLIQTSPILENLDIFTRFCGILSDPASITFTIVSPTGALFPSNVDGFRNSVGHYDARNFGSIPYGLDQTPWKICWTIVSPAGITTTEEELFFIKAVN